MKARPDRSSYAGESRGLSLPFFALVSLLAAASAIGAEIRHSFLATGGFTRIVAEDGSVGWTTPQSSRDGWVLADDDFLLTFSKSKEHPGGAVVRMNRAGEAKLIFAGTQSEVNTSQLLASGNVVLTEAGPKPRLLEVDASGKIVVEFPLQCQLTNHHMQSRMTRKLANGNYLVPQLLDKVVREYTPAGKVAWEVATPNWPFTAIRLANGNTLIGCTYGNVVIEVDSTGKTVWQVSNDDFDGAPIKDACGVQRLANGNTVITSYGIGENRLKLMEVTRDKKIVWIYTDESKPGIHHFQILTTNGKVEPGPALR